MDDSNITNELNRFQNQMDSLTKLDFSKQKINKDGTIVKRSFLGRAFHFLNKKAQKNLQQNEIKNQLNKLEKLFSDNKNSFTENDKRLAEGIASSALVHQKAEADQKGKKAMKKGKINAEDYKTFMNKHPGSEGVIINIATQLIEKIQQPHTQKNPNG